MSASRLTILPLFSMSTVRMRFSLRVSSARCPPAGHRPVGGIEDEIPMGQQGALPREITGAAQKRLHLGHENAEGEGLGDKIIRPRIQSAQDVEIVPCRGDEQNGRRTDFADLGAQAIAVKERQGNVHQHQLGIEGDKLAQYVLKSSTPRASSPQRAM